MSDLIPVALSGLPGKMALAVAEEAVEQNERFQLLPFALTGPEMPKSLDVRGTTVKLLSSDQKGEFAQRVHDTPGAIVIDYTHPTAVNANAEFYCKEQLPFVMGTTGGDRDALNQIASESECPSVIAPNMGLPIVALTAMLDWGARQFPGVFSGYKLEVKESHQITKADTSGTAKHLIGFLQDMGASFSADQNLYLCRTQEEQRQDWKIPEEHLMGHAYHTYELKSDDGGSSFRIDHNVLGRQIYAKGTLEAAAFLRSQLNEKKSHVLPWTMIDVLQNLRT